MNNNSIWTINLKEEKINKLTKDITVDILIIGGGMTGLSTAYQLINKGLNIAVVERNRIGMGITSRSTAKITYLQENIYSKLKKYHNEEVSKKYLDSQLEAIDTIKRIIQDNKIDCDFYKVDSYLFTEDKEKIKDVKEEKELLEKFGIKTKEFNKLPDNKKVKYSFSVSNTYVFHPIKYLRSLKNI
ncbi:MAG: FAD-binding oxidoreductase, partial [Bacilli bacterium]|nr:FAD-binding oxidoreductase [Bacilli bacterium]